MLLAISVIIFLWHATATSAQCNQRLVAITECVCPGQTVVYRCSVMGGIFTVYNGTAFECSLREISLGNNAFGTANNPMQRCNGQQISITGMGLSNMNGCFTSQINVTLGDSGESGRTISCGVDDGSGTVRSIGTTTLDISTVGLAPPIVSLTAASPSYVTFSWNPVSSNCPSLHYNITSRNCGICPNRADTTSVNCTDFSVALSRDGALECVLSVQTVICGGTSASVGGNLASTSVALKVPSPPNLSIIPYYFENDRLKGFDASITLTDPIPVQISDSFNASAKSIHFTFVNDKNEICRDETEVQVSNSCVGVVCSHYSSETCSTTSSTETGVSVHASNILGNGMMSSKRIISSINGFVRIRFELSLTTNPRTGTVECIFIDSRDGRKTCEIVIKRGDMFVNKTDQTPSDSDNIVRINVDDLLVNEGMNEVNELSYTITASDDTGRVVVVQDVHSLSSPTVNTGGIAGGTVGAIVAAVIFVVFAVAVVLFILRQPWRQVEKEGISVETRKYEADADLDSGMLYRKTTPNEFLPPIDGKLIAHNDETKRSFGLDSADLARLFVDDHRQVRQVRKYSLCIQIFSRPHFFDATNYLICEHNPAKNNLLSQITPEPQLPEGVQRLDHWFKIIEVQNHGDQLSAVCTTNKLNVFTEQDNCRLFYTDIRKTLPRQGKLNRLRVLAVDYNEHLYDDKDKNLAFDRLAGKELKKWKGIFFQAINNADRSMTKGSMVLFYDPSLELVSKPFERYKTSSDCEEMILRFITNKTGNDQCTLENIYRQWDREIQDGREIPADLKLVALSENNRLYNIASRDSILGHLKEGRCTHVFVLVQEDELAPPDTLFLYIPSQ